MLSPKKGSGCDVRACLYFLRPNKDGAESETVWKLLQFRFSALTKYRLIEMEMSTEEDVVS